jgi:hypothetical protein
MRTKRPAGASRPATSTTGGRGRPARPAGRLGLAAAAALALVALAAGPAAADAASVAAALRGNPVFVDPDAPIKPDKAGLLEQVQAAGTPIFIAVLPDAARQETGGNTDELGRRIANRLREQGTYLVTAGTTWTAASTQLEAGEARRLAAQAFEAHGRDLDAALGQWVGGVAAAARGAGEPAAQTSGDGGGGAGGVLAGVAVATVLVVGGGALIFGARRRRREREAQRLRELEEVKAVAQEDLVALADDIRALDLDTSMPDADPEAVRHYTEAVDHYQRAAAALDRARRAEDMAQVSTALEAGRFSMASAKAILEGRPPPEHRPPCFFDPRHGPSVEDVEWAPPDGSPRPVPACAADAQRIRDGLEPMAREVVGAGGRMTPYWNAPGYYGPWAGGYFGGFPMGGLFTGLLLGSFLGGGWGYPVSVDGGGEGGGDGGGDTGGGGDWGGGDWGGGGGDWGGGGGDFGGGDFGG